MRNNLKKKVCSLLVATLMTTATFANGFTYGGITVSAEESNVTVQNSGNVEISGEKTYSDINDSTGSGVNTRDVETSTVETTTGETVETSTDETTMPETTVEPTTEEPTTEEPTTPQPTTVPVTTKPASTKVVAWGKNAAGQFVNGNKKVIKGATMKGVDVSYHNGTINWKKVAASDVDYAIIRCGYESVASMIVYEDGKPKRNNYRKFRIKSVKGPDDYASMREVLTRRFRHGIEEREKLDMEEKDYKLGSFSNFPDILMMDGGKGQVNIALEVLDSLNLHIPVCGMVKDDNHRTRGLYYNNEEIPIAKNSEGFRLITRMQDETHRFAIEYHRSLRNKKQVHSILDDIPGVGPARRKALMREFKSIEGIREATVEQLSQVDTISEKVAKDIYKFFH